MPAFLWGWLWLFFSVLSGFVSIALAVSGGARFCNLRWTLCTLLFFQLSCLLFYLLQLPHLKLWKWPGWLRTFIEILFPDTWPPASHLTSYICKCSLLNTQVNFPGVSANTIGKKPPKFERKCCEQQLQSCVSLLPHMEAYIMEIQQGSAMISRQ